MTFRRALVAGTLALLAAVAATVAAARADQAYTVDGHDVFRIGGGEVQSRTVYHGTQQLSIARDGGGTHYVARVEYDKSGDGGKQHEHASFAATLLPSGDQHDGPAHDPDYLTVLNQPFAVQLDAADHARPLARQAGGAVRLPLADDRRAAARDAAPAARRACWATSA